MGIPEVAPPLVARAGAGPCGRVLSNGRLTTLLTAAGTGFTNFGWRRVTDWRADPVEDGGGLFVYVRDEEDGALWSAGLAPVAGAPERYEASDEPGCLRIARLERGIETLCEAVVAADADAELRRITLRNPGSRRRRLTVTTFAGLVLHHAGAHAGHPAFSKLFVQTRLERGSGVLLARRRPREPEPEALHAAHALFGPGTARFETDRARFLGRWRSPARPAALAPGGALSGTVGNVLDPMVSVQRAVDLAPGEGVALCSVLACAGGEEDALAMAVRFAPAAAFEAARAAAVAQARERLAGAGLSPGQGAYLDALLTHMLHGAPRLRAGPDVLRRTRGSAEDLWVFGLPPDQPLVVVEEGPSAPSLLADLERARSWWAALGIPVNVLSMGEAAKAGKEPRFLDSARACARLVLRDAWPSLASDAEQPLQLWNRPSGPEKASDAVPATSSDEALVLWNGFGGFSQDGREYVIRLGAPPPQPWVNVIATPSFGTLVSERGAATTWHGNSREHRLTPWSNDPLGDPHGEALWVRDEAAGIFWSPQPGPTPSGAACEVRHGFGETSWRQRSHGLLQEVTTLVAADAPLKLTRVRLTNMAAEPRTLSLFSYARLVLGVLPEDDARAVVVEAAQGGRLLRARNGLAGPFAGGVAFAAMACHGAPEEGARFAASADRAAFLGPGGTPAAPRALVEDDLLDAAGAAPLDACFAQQVTLTLPAGGHADCLAMLGEGEDDAQVDDLVGRFGAAGAFDAARAAVRASWEETLGAVQVRTPSAALDALVNGWLAYQTLSCRIQGRTACYQSGGAFGFRDQLQDAAALALARPDLTRAQILLHAAHQFSEGDVLHWWHPPADRGTRTRFSDDLLWLPFVTAQYVATTGDRTVLDEHAGFVAARELAAGEDEAYLPTTPAGESAPVYEHCCRAIDRSLGVGAHGLPLMGTGDWNDGMNRVGREGRGESVWMAFFLADVLRRFAPLCAERGDAERARRYAAHRESLANAVEANAWDGAWYRRAYFDDGTPLGTAAAEECRIDILPQAWAVLSGAAPRARGEVAMDSVERELLLEDGGLIRLLAPPFDHMTPSPGYIQGYVPGIRENGGQYTHAAMWAVRAMAELGRRDRALAWLEMLLPTSHARTPEAVARYQVEPYVVAADVYAVAPHVGRGGWTWYTGSAGWMLQVALESVLGLGIEEGRRIRLRPCIPDEWPAFEMRLRLPGHGTRYAIRVGNPQGRAECVTRVRADGGELAPVDGAALVPIVADGGDHVIAVELGPA